MPYPTKSRAAIILAGTTLFLAMLFLAMNVAPATSLTPADSPRTLAELAIRASGNYTTYLALIRRDPTPTPTPTPTFTPTPTSFAFYDSFDNPASGWPIKSFNANDPFPPGPYASGYGKEKLSKTTTGPNNVFNVKTVAAWNSWVYAAPVVLADPQHFTIELIGKSAQSFMWLSSWGVYFNANASRTKMYTVQIYQNGNPADGTPPEYHARRWDDFNGTAHANNQELSSKRRCGRCTPTDYEWNRIRVVRDGDTLYVYLGSSGWWQLQAVYNAPWYTTSEYVGVGVFNGNFEWSDWQRGDQPTYQVDEFYVNPARYP